MLALCVFCVWVNTFEWWLLEPGTCTSLAVFTSHWFPAVEFCGALFSTLSKRRDGATNSDLIVS